MADFFSIFFWWLIVFLAGAAVLPLTFRIFPDFFDRGYAFAKISGIFGLSYLVWMLGSLKILPFAAPLVWLLLALIAVLNFRLVQPKLKEFKKTLQDHWQLFAFEELLFGGGLLIWALVRGYQPDIQGLEKFMDFGFVNAILRTQFFPPPDMWLAGETINYYYFGHLVSAVLTKLSELDPAVAYNLMVATLFGLALSGGFSLGGNIHKISKSEFLNPKQARNSKFKLPQPWLLFRNWKLDNWKLPVIAGLISSLLLSFGGNLHPLYWFIKEHNYRSYWYPDATRFIVEKFGAADNTIHEFPLYSFVVADLHGHLLNLPNVLLMLALVLQLSSLLKNKKISFQKLLPALGLLALGLGISFMTNAWDYPIYSLIAGLVVILALLPRLKKRFTKTAALIAQIGFFLLAVSLLTTLPFQLSFDNIAQGIAATNFHSPWWMLPVLWGFPALITVIFLFSNRDNRSYMTNIFPPVLLAVSWLLIALPELIYIKDIYIHSHQRANTMFKLTYQSFVMFSILGGPILVTAFSNIKKVIFRRLFLIFCFSFFIFLFLYPYFAVKSYYGLKNYRGLYGLEFLEKSYPEDYQAILWLNKYVPGQPVIVEAVGESYTDFARVSANTGLPAVLGWRVHEWLWRGSFDEAGKRTEEVRQIYEADSAKEIKPLLNKHQVKYVVVGDLERQQYPELNETKFEELGEAVFVSGKTVIYKID